MLWDKNKNLLIKLCGVLLMSVFFVLIPLSVSARPVEWHSSMLSERPLTRRQEGLDIRGTVPVIYNDFFVSAAMINNHIDNNIVTSLVSEARRLRARSITFWYQHYETNDFVSLVIYAEVATTLPHTLVRSVNFSRMDGRLVSMNEATGMEIVPLAERILTDRIRSNPEIYYNALSAPLANQAFYLTHDSLVILFDDFRLSSRAGEGNFIELILDNINTVVLEPGDYRRDGPYGLKMIPLRAVLEGQLGFNVTWDGLDERVIIRRNDVNLIELRKHDNDYILIGIQRVSLEVAPQIYDNSMYIPITFFDQVLPNTTFSINSDGSITFLSYITD